MSSTARWREILVIIELDDGPSYELKYNTNRLGKHMWAEAFWRGICDPRSSNTRIRTITIDEGL